MLINESFAFFHDADGLRFEFPGGGAIAFPVGSLFHYSCGRPWDDSARGFEITKTDNGYILTDGKICARMSLTACGDYVRLDLTAENKTNEVMDNFSCGLVFDIAADGIKATVPHLLYNDNPSASSERVVPHIGSVPGKGTIAEEHRLPIPAVNLEWMIKEEPVFFTLLSVPEIITGDDDEY